MHIHHRITVIQHCKPNSCCPWYLNEMSMVRFAYDEGKRQAWDIRMSSPRAKPPADFGIYRPLHSMITWSRSDSKFQGINFTSKTVLLLTFHLPSHHFPSSQANRSRNRVFSIWNSKDRIQKCAHISAQTLCPAIHLKWFRWICLIRWTPTGHHNVKTTESTVTQMGWMDIQMESMAQLRLREC